VDVADTPGVTVAHAWNPGRSSARLVALLIGAYQRYVSPHKGFGCAVRVRRERLPCAEFAKRAVMRRGAVGAIPLVRRRLRLCAQTAKSKPPLDYEPLPVPAKRKRTKREQMRDCLWNVDAGCTSCDAGDAVLCAGLSGIDCCDCTPW
jgi:putative component of membrane protein insertase Oxa1/YidC/SpoIIIJ protein YidD